MGTVNKVLLVGRLGKDPDDRVTTGGTRVSQFSVATDQIRNGNGGSQKITEWHRVVTYGKTAESCNLYLRKGRLVCVEGSLQTRSWEKPPGERHFMTEVVASRVTFLDSKSKGSPSEIIAEEDNESG
jgi:single-strand DNA-binding protein